MGELDNSGYWLYIKALQLKKIKFLSELFLVLIRILRRHHKFGVKNKRKNKTLNFSKMVEIYPHLLTRCMITPIIHINTFVFCWFLCISVLKFCFVLLIYFHCISEFYYFFFNFFFKLGYTLLLYIWLVVIWFYHTELNFI